ncbi:MAG: hypothetical protein B6U78_00335 [Candidatus Aenigmarchaeota archaeon ex4484_224]|nr:MAG: hypothetical protein B6U78_00335 [Candidatus Aenigmarchaeota archaeon ex4484_224]
MIKGVGWYILFVIFLIGLFLLALSIVFPQIFPHFSNYSLRYACVRKLQSFCYKWITTGIKEDWNSIPPFDCSKVGISEPKREECENLISK